MIFFRYTRSRMNSPKRIEISQAHKVILRQQLHIDLIVFGWINSITFRWMHGNFDLQFSADSLSSSSHIDTLFSSFLFYGSCIRHCLHIKVFLRMPKKKPFPKNSLNALRNGVGRMRWLFHQKKMSNQFKASEKKETRILAMLTLWHMQRHRNKSYERMQDAYIDCLDTRCKENERTNNEIHRIMIIKCEHAFCIQSLNSIRLRLLGILYERATRRTTRPTFSHTNTRATELAITFYNNTSFIAQSPACRNCDTQIWAAMAIKAAQETTNKY